MALCPRGHTSLAEDYCDECGAAIGGPAPQPSTSDPKSAAADATAGGPCPQCGTDRTGRFCEVCGYDFVLAALGGGTQASAPNGVGPASTPPVLDSGPPAGTPANEPRPGGAPPANRAADLPPTPAASPAAGPDGLPAPAAQGAASPVVAASTQTVAPDKPAGAAPATTTTWYVLATADRGYFDRMRTEAGPDAAEVTFPAYCPQRRFTLSGSQLLIGRRSRSRGIEPQIDLTGPPEDAGVSHAHALLVARDGGWAVVDLESANGTYLNDGTDPIAGNTPVPLADGDRVHVGAWTTLTLHAV